MKECSRNSRDPVVLATAYYPTVFASASSTPKVSTNTNPGFPTASSTGSANELDLKDVVPYLKHLSLSAEHVIYKPPTAMQLSNVSASTCQRVLDTYRQVPTITLAVETGPFAFNFVDVSEVSEADKIGKLCPPDPVELDGIATELMNFKPDVEESYWEGEFWRALTAARDAGRMTRDLMKQSRLRRQRLMSLSRASVSTVMGSPTLNAAMTPLSSQISINSTPMSNSVELNTIININSGSLWRVHHPCYFPHNSLKSMHSARVDGSHQQKTDADAALATPKTTTAQRNAKGFLRRAWFNEKQRGSSFTFRKSLTLQGCNRSPSHVGRSLKGTTYKENLYPTSSEKRGFKVPVPSIASESSGCLDVNSFVESAPTSTLPTGAETPIAIHTTQNNTSLYSSPLNTQNTYVNDVIGIATLHSNTTTTVSRKGKEASRDNTSNGIGSTTALANKSCDVLTADLLQSRRTRDNAALTTTPSGPLSQREPRKPQDQKSSSSKKLPSIRAFPSFSTIKRDKSVSSKQVLNSVRSTPVIVSGSAAFDSPPLKRSQLTSLDRSCSQRTSQPSAAAAVKDDPLSPNLIISDSIHSGSRVGESPNACARFPGANTIASAFEQIEGGREQEETISNVLCGAPDQVLNEERMVCVDKGSDQISFLPLKTDAMALPSKVQSPKQGREMAVAEVCLDSHQTQENHTNGEPLHQDTKESASRPLHPSDPSKGEKDSLEGTRPMGRTIVKVAAIPSRSALKPRPFHWKKAVTGAALLEDRKFPSSSSAQVVLDDKYVSPLAHTSSNSTLIAQNDTDVHCVPTPLPCQSSALPSQLSNLKPLEKHNFGDSPCTHRGGSSLSLSLNSSARDMHNNSTHSCQPLQSLRTGDMPILVSDMREDVGISNKDSRKRQGHLLKAKANQPRCCVVM
ncbi:unnamed protein product [Phytomonas sp. EM1]|nr:unnamed protein product [Phytomonas sp. EM1]|eukprot:CCW60367.1 unnamed protein product [Phytomonas sp. isolate EM1]